jgi:hypothetical protein
VALENRADATMTKRLILTNDDSATGTIRVARLADSVVALSRQFIWGPLPSDAELTKLFEAPRELLLSIGPQDHPPQFNPSKLGAPNPGLIELCARFDAIELWIDPNPNDQLQLICLLHYLRPHKEIASRLTLRQAYARIADRMPKELAKWRLPGVRIGIDHLELANRAWRAFGAPTPQDWFGLLAKDLSILPRLRSAVIELLEELPWRATGLGATEMRMLHFISEGKWSPPDFFHHEFRNPRRLFHYWELGALLDGLAHCKAPAVTGLKEGPFTLEMHDDRARRKRCNKSKLSLTPLGGAILGQMDDFSRHNPIRRWWGGTKLTNKRLWRWDPNDHTLVAP